MKDSTVSSHTDGPVFVRPLGENDLHEADRIFRLAFGTFIRLPDPMQFAAGCDFIRTRWRAAPDQTLGIQVDGHLAGSNILTRWGSFGFFGPLTIRPDFWEQGLAKRLLAATADLFLQWNLRHAGLFTFPHSAKHIGLYQKFGFWPRFLTALMSKAPENSSRIPGECCFSKLADGDRASALRECRALADEICSGLDLSHEIKSVHKHSLGETVLTWENSRLAAFAVCHCGAGTEAGPETCYIKFAVVRPGPSAKKHFARLLDACEAVARNRGLTRMLAGVNLESRQAYHDLLARGFRTENQGVSMHQNNEPGFCKPDVFVLGDWR